MPIPRNYEQWRHCITVECGIALTPTFLSERFGGGAMSAQKRLCDIDASTVIATGQWFRDGLSEH